MKQIALALAILLPFSQEVLAAQAQMKKPDLSQGDITECSQDIKDCLSWKKQENHENCVTACEKAKLSCKTNRSIKGQIEKGKPETPFDMAKTYSLHCKNKIKDRQKETQK